MYSPSLSDNSLGISRRDVAESRGADAVHGMLEWQVDTRKPTVAGFFATRDKIEAHSLTRRVLFTGNFWMADQPVSAWRPMTVTEDAKRVGTTIGAMHGILTAKGSVPVSTAKAKSFNELSLEPMDAPATLEMQSLQRVAALELRVEVVQFSRPAAGANGVSTGKVMAVSENYAAQHIGNNKVVVHEHKNLSRPLTAGEDATLAYENGKATVHGGLAHDINIVAPWMPNDQKAYLRMVMFDALASMTEPQSDDERLRDAMRYALESTANFFGIQETKLRRADINLVVNEKSSTLRATEPSATVARSMRA